MPIKILSNNQSVDVLVPCANELKVLNNNIDTLIEIRRRKLILLGDKEVWGVSVDGVELYYQNRIKYRRNPLLWFISLLSLLIPVIFYKFIFLSVRK